MIWGGSWERGFMFGNSCTPVVDSCQCMAKPIQYFKVKKKIKNFKKRKKKKKLLKESTCKALSNKNCTIVFLGRSPKAKAIVIKAKINKWDLVKLTSFHTTKKTIKEKKKRTYRVRENICK